MVHKIYLPNGKGFKVNTKETPVDINQLRGLIDQSIAEGRSVAVEIIDGDKEATLVLWGDVLKNSFVLIEKP